MARSRSRARLAHLAAAVTTTTTELELEALDERLAVGRLDPETVPREALLELMRPEPGGPTETERLMDGVAHHINSGPPLIEPDGRVTPATLERLQAEQRAAARRGDYPAAYQLKAVRDVLAPREPYTLAECAPTDVDAQVAFFETNGFVCVENAIEGPQLAAVQEAWEEHAAYSAAQWEASRANGVGIARHGFRAMRDGSPGVSRKIYSLESDTGENPFLSDPRLAELTAPQHILPLLTRLLCNSEERPRCGGVGPRVTPPDADAAGYTYWHRVSTSPPDWPTTVAAADLLLCLLCTGLPAAFGSVQRPPRNRPAAPPTPEGLHQHLRRRP